MIIILQTLIFIRDSLLRAIDHVLTPVLFGGVFPTIKSADSDEDENEEQVYSEYDNEKGVVFFPPVYAQRYAAVMDCLMDDRWHGKLEKVVDMGYHDASFIKYLKELSGIHTILAVDLESLPLRCSSDLIRSNNIKKEDPVHICLLQGNAADPDYRLIGCDAVVAIEMIEHMLPHDLERLVHTVFGFIKPWVAIFTTPNGDFNVLFKALESNGLRRLDHFFEWSREQFNDWCTNIVERYPQYTVTCKGVGPGPAGTEHLGCCSQLALFINKDYNKQRDLTIDKLALVAGVPEAYEFPSDGDEVECLNDDYLYENLGSMTEIICSQNQSCMTIVISPPSYTQLEAITYSEKGSQCNITVERQKSFMMFNDEELCFKIMAPRRKQINNRVYVIEDVRCRLNCTTLQVRKFSKKTWNMLAKNKIDPLINTREIVDKMQQLRKKLHVDYKQLTETNNAQAPIWNNINWGENAPYWNQYYRTVREYEYPFETKSEEQRILEVITEEINKHVDLQDQNDAIGNKTEIPIEQIMWSVEHITQDVDKIKELLEWNGYEIVDNVIILTRPMSDDSHVGHDGDISERTPTDDETTELSSVSETSTIMSEKPICNAFRFRRALNKKLKKLRSMLAGEQDATQELEKVFCRLMKLIQNHSRRSFVSPPDKWVQYKLYDLLTLSEKALERRQFSYRANLQHFPVLMTYDLGRNGFNHNTKEALLKYTGKAATSALLEKYLDIITSSKDLRENVDNQYAKFYKDPSQSDTNFVTAQDIEDVEETYCHSTKIENYDNMTQSNTNTSTELTKVSEYALPSFEDILNSSLTKISKHIASSSKSNTKIKDLYSNNLDNDKANGWYDEIFGTAQSVRHRGTYSDVSGTTDSSHINPLRVSSQLELMKDKIYNENLNENSNIKERNKVRSAYFKCYSKNTDKSTHSQDNKENETEICTNVQKSLANPIPETLIGFCPSDATPDKQFVYINNSLTEKINNAQDIFDLPGGIEFGRASDTTEESFIKNIVMDDPTESCEFLISEVTNDDGIDIQNGIVRKTSRNRAFQNLYDNFNSDGSIFLNDINVPSTSKGIGIKHYCVDVECGPDINMISDTDISKVERITSKSFVTLNSRENMCEETSTRFYREDYIQNGNKYVSRPIERGIRINENYFDIEYSKISNNVFGKEENDLKIDTAKPSECKSMIENMNAARTLQRLNYITESDCSDSSNKQNKWQMIENTLELQNFFESRNENKAIFSDSPKITNDIFSLYEMSSNDTTQDIMKAIATSVSEKCSRNSVINAPIKLNVESSQVNIELNSDGSITQNIVKRMSTASISSKFNCGGLCIQSYKERLSSEDVLLQEGCPKHATNTFSRRKLYGKNLNSSKESHRKKNQYEVRPTNITRNESAMVKKKIGTKFTAKHQNINITKVNSIVKNQDFNKIITNRLDTGKSLVKNVPRSMELTSRSPVLKSPAAKKKTDNVSCKKPSALKKLDSSNNNDKNRNKRVKWNIKNLKVDKNSKNNNVAKSLTKTFSEQLADNLCLPNEIYREEIHRNLFNVKDTLGKRLSYVVLQNEYHKTNNGFMTTKISSGSTSQTKSDCAPVKASSATTGSSAACSSKNISGVKILQNKSKIPVSKKVLPNIKESLIANKQGSSFATKKVVMRCKSSKISENSVQKINIDQSNSSALRVLDPKVKCNLLKQKDVVECKNKITEETKNQYIGQIIVSDTAVSLMSDETYNIDTNSDDNSKSSRSTVSISGKKMVTEKILSMETSHNMDSGVDFNITLAIERIKYAIQATYPVQIEKKVEGCENSSTIDDKINFVEDGSIVEDILHSVNSRVIEIILENEIDKICDNISETKNQVTRSLSNETVIAKPIETAPSLQCSENPSITIENPEFSKMDHSELSKLQLRSNNIISSLTLLSDKKLYSLNSETTVSKISEYYLADTELNNIDETESQASDVGVVKNIFERKEQTITDVPVGNLAQQVFSGFSINESGMESMIGDSGNFVNIIDSETGSGAMPIRQTNSEELFLSGRSSMSFASCTVDDESMVPSWVFDAANNEEEDDHPIPIRLPVTEPMFDSNGNMVEVGPGAGAGDGQGMHSNSSQETSSGATSTSISDTSSDRLSANFVLEPIAFVGEIQMARNSRSRPLSPPPVASPVLVSLEVQNHETRAIAHGRSCRAVATSDVDGDVSSLDTDN